MSPTQRRNRQAVAANQQPKAKEYWHETLAGCTFRTAFPHDFLRTTPGEKQRGRETFELPEGGAAKLLELSRNSQQTLHLYLAALTVLMLYKYTGSSDIIIGTPIYKQKDKQNTAGELSNTLLPLRAGISSGDTFKTLLKKLAAALTGAIAHQGYPVEILAEQMGLETNPDFFPLLDVIVLLENLQEQSYTRHIQTGFNLVYVNDNRRIRGTVDYDTAVYGPATIRRIVKHMSDLPQQVLTRMDDPLEQISLVSETERQQQLNEMNRSALEYNVSGTIPGLFQQQVEQTPDNIALIDEQQEISYSRLNRWADAVARRLITRGVGPGDIVGLVTERRAETIAAILGILKAGAAYLPLEPGYPHARLQQMLEDSGTRHVVAGEQVLEQYDLNHLFETAPSLGNPIVKVTPNTVEEQEGTEPAGTGLPGEDVQPGDLAYIIFTSGSTGIPKGILTTHANVLRVVKGTNYIEISPRDRLLQLSSIAFDGSVFDIFGALLNGAALVLLRTPRLLDVKGLPQLIHDKGVTLFFTTTALFNTLVDAGLNQLKGIRKILFGGERGSVEHTRAAVETLGPERLLHMYGPTETTVYATYYPVQDVPAGSLTVPIGYPLAGTFLVLLDENLHPVPVGVPAELYIGGSGVARGYMNRPELTAEGFIASPFDEDQRLYRSGDVVRRLETGAIEFIGRRDQQVKIRGFRIEPGEIESRLLSHHKVEQAVVTVRQDSGDEKYLCAYVTLNTGAESAGAGTELKQYLTQELPAYMTPSYIIPLTAVPLTPNGKVDLKALPQPEAAHRGQDYSPPRNNVEKVLTETWGEMLKRPPQEIGIDDDFFQLGGHSLKVTILSTQIEKDFDVRLTLPDMFAHPTIRAMAELIRTAQRDIHREIPATETREYYPLSSAQKRLFFLNQMDKKSTGYNIPTAYIVEGALEIQKLKQVFQALVTRHESLRTSFLWVKEQPVQRIHKNVTFQLEETPVVTEAIPVERGGQTEVIDKLLREFLQPFQLTRPPLLRVQLTELQENRYLLLVDMHHIISDGTSLRILVEEFLPLYRAEVLPGLALQYKDYTCWQKGQVAGGALQKQQEYWLGQYSERVPGLDLPIDFCRPPQPDYRGGQVHFALEAPQTAGLKTLAEETGTTLFILLLALFKIFLAKLSGQEDFAVGIPIAGRRHQALQRVIGMFVNTLAIRSKPAHDKTLRDFIGEVREQALNAYENQEYQLEELVEKLELQRDTSRNPLFDVMFAMQDTDNRQLEVPGLKLTPPPYDSRNSKFDLTFSFVEADGRMLFQVEYSTALFFEKTIARYSDYFKQTVAEVLLNQNKETKIKEIRQVPRQELEQMLNRFNETKTRYPAEKTLHGLFEEQVEKTPDNIALEFKEDALTYRTLNEKAAGLAAELKEKGVTPGTITAVMLERSMELIVGILAVLKAGGAYLPVEPRYPQKRIRYMLEDSAARFFLTQGNILKRHPVEYDGIVIDMETTDKYTGTAPQKTGIQTKPTDSAYVIYTSGTTGNPKGVVVEHTSVVNLICCQQKRYGITVRDRVLQTSSICFDASVEQIYIALLKGSVLALIDTNTLLDNPRFETFISQRAITHIDTVPSFLNQIDLKGKLSLKRIVSGGEVLPISLAEKLSGNCGLFNGALYNRDLFNQYGPTEATVTALSMKVEEIDGTMPRVPIGRPIGNTVVYLLDKWKEPLPPGITGELYIGGTGVARGYLNRPELTGDRFTTNPLEPGQQLYRTGDMGRWNANGEIEFLGRIDRQVKIRGIRIEPGEIENRLLAHEKIKEAAVVVKKDGSGDDYLAAYTVSNTTEPLTVANMRDYLAKTLPDYMIPSYFLEMEALPLTPNGKIDNRALPAIEPAAGEQYTAPRDEREKQLTGIWSDVLGVEAKRIGIDDNFFQLGGHSLKTMVLVGKIHKTFGVELPLSDIFKGPTIRHLGKLIDGAVEVAYHAVEPAQEKPYYAVSAAQKRMYVLQQMAPGSIDYNMPMALSLEGVPEPEKLTLAFKGLIQRHEVLRTGIEVRDNLPVQVIHTGVEFEIEQPGQEETDYSSSELEHRLTRFVRPFDLSKPPLMRVGMIKTGERRHIMMVDMHHIITDAVSGNIATADFMALYAGGELPPLKFRYRDFSEWQNRLETGDQLRKQEEYWLGRFEGGPPQLNLPLDYPGTKTTGTEGRRFYFEIEPGPAAQIKELNRESGTTPFMVLLTLYHLLLSRYAEQQDIVTGSAIAGRRHPDLRHIMGMFVNMLTIRTQPLEEYTFMEYLNQVKKHALNAYENQDYQFDRLVTALGVETRSGRNPLFDAQFTLQNATQPVKEEKTIETTGLVLKPYPYDNKVTPFDLGLNAMETGDTFSMVFIYKTALFKHNTIENMSHHYKEILQQCMTNKELTLKEITVTHELKTGETTLNEEELDGFDF